MPLQKWVYLLKFSKFQQLVLTNKEFSMHKKISLFVLLLLIIIAFTRQSYAVEFNLGSSVEVGGITIDDQPYTRFVITPDITLNIDVQLTLQLLFDFDKDFKLREGLYSTWKDVINRIKLFRIGDMGEKFYFKIGVFENFSIGHGTIMYKFSNNVFAPTLIMQGLFLYLDTGDVGLEYFTENILDLDIHIARFFARPFKSIDYFFLKDLVLGFTFSADLDNRDPTQTGTASIGFKDDEVSEDDLFIRGTDMEIPFEFWIFKWTFYASYNYINNRGSGMSIGISGQFFEYIDWKIDVNRFSDRYKAPYFDSYYMTQRATKYSTFTNTQNQSSYTGIKLSTWKSFKVVKEDDIYVNLSLSWNEGERVRGDIKLKISPNLMGKIFEFNMEYSRMEVNNLSDLFSIHGLYSIAKISLKFIPSENSSVELVYQKGFSKDESGNITGQESTSLQSSTKF